MCDRDSPMLSPTEISLPDELSDTPPHDLTINPLYEDDDKVKPKALPTGSLICDPTFSNTEPTLRSTIVTELSSDPDEMAELDAGHGSGGSCVTQALHCTNYMVLSPK